jgi:hypothetical protein
MEILPMKKTLWLIVCIAFLPAAALAQTTTLYDMSDSMLTLAEATLSCMAGQDACSEAEVMALQADARQGMRDLVWMLRSGNLSGLKLTGGQAAVLQERAAGLQDKMMHASGLLQGVCNDGVSLVNTWVGMMAFIMYHPAYGVLLFPVLLVLSLMLLVPGVILMLTCPFWWL